MQTNVQIDSSGGNAHIKHREHYTIEVSANNNDNNAYSTPIENVKLQIHSLYFPGPTAYCILADVLLRKAAMSFSHIISMRWHFLFGLFL